MYSLATLIAFLVWAVLASAFIYAVICFVKSAAYSALRERMIKRLAHQRSTKK